MMYWIKEIAANKTLVMWWGEGKCSVVLWLGLYFGKLVCVDCELLNHFSRFFFFFSLGGAGWAEWAGVEYFPSHTWSLLFY